MNMGPSCSMRKEAVTPAWLFRASCVAAGSGSGTGVLQRVPAGSLIPYQQEERPQTKFFYATSAGPINQ